MLTAQTYILYSTPRPSVLTLILQTPQFVPPVRQPSSESTNYSAAHSGSLSKQKIVSGKSFDHFIQIGFTSFARIYRFMIAHLPYQIWLENADFESVNSTATFYDLAKQGILLDRYHALAHPSEPNYIAAAGGDRISIIVDLLEAKNISWASYQENLPSDGFEGVNFFSTNYLNTRAPVYSFYVREHNPTVFYDSVASVPSRSVLHRNFNDFAIGPNASALPQWMFVTPNMVNDGHDTTIDFAAQWIGHSINNRFFFLLLGDAVPENANRGLGSLGRGDANKMLSNVYSVADATGHKNLDVPPADFPLTNFTGTIPGLLNARKFLPILAPNTPAVGAVGGPVFIAPSFDTSITTPLTVVNLTAQGKSVRWLGPRLSSNFRLAQAQSLSLGPSVWEWFEVATKSRIKSISMGYTKAPRKESA
ncbi:hypothetical protein EDB89DRAFT_2078302 [Lactarius sanguifluus]|nr:hypothetical protein EDB89DRAFT_2078302 [Lactarius sanguifluus]